MADINLDLASFVMAAGGLGTAAMGIVEGLKATWIRPIGFGKLETNMAWARDALKCAYGDEYSKLLTSLFRFGRSSGELPRILRQGVRIGLSKDNAAGMGREVIGDAGGRLAGVAEKSAAGKDLNEDERNILGRFEVAADARIDAALALAERAYQNGMRYYASGAAVVLAMIAAYLLANNRDAYVTALFVGLVSVPLAPIAKDVAKGLQSATKALAARS